jgi:hypothetical protein
VIPAEEFVERLCRLGADRGPRRFPRRVRDRVAPAIATDHVTLRRLLVDYGHVEPTADGRWYRVGFPARPVAFDLEVDQIDVRATIAAYLDLATRRRR